MEYKNIRLNRDSVEGRTVSGYASVFGNRDKVGDIVQAGAFAKTLKERGKRVKVFYNHMYPIGMPVKIAEDEKGLYTESVLSKTARADEILELIKDGVIDEMSFAYEVIDHKPMQNGGRILKELKLFEYGFVDFGANEKAQIVGVKSLIERIHDVKDEESYQELKDALQLLEAVIQSYKKKPSIDTSEPSIDTLEKIKYFCNLTLIK